MPRALTLEDLDIITGHRDDTESGCPANDRASVGSAAAPEIPPCPLGRGGVWPKVGSAEWCACLDKVVAWVNSVGSQVIDFLLEPQSADGESNFWGTLLGAINPGASVVKATAKLAGEIANGVSAKVRSVLASVQSAIANGPVCNPSSIIGIETVRALIHALEKLRIGTDAVVWITLDLRFTVQTLSRILDYVEGYVCPVEIPTWGEVVGCYLGNTAPEGLLRCWAAMGHKDWQVNLPVLRSVRRKPETVESGIIRNRQYVNDDGYKALLRQLGFTDQAEAELIGKLRFEVPGPSDLVRFALRHVFEPDLTARFGHQDEQRPILDFFHQTAGLNYKIYTGPLADTIIGTLKEQPEIYQALQAWATAEGLPAPPAADQVPQWLAGLYRAQGLQEPTWATAYWWSHWVWPAPTQAYQMLFRLRPDRDKTGEPDWMRPLSFTLDDMRSLLRGNDYAPYWRDRLAAIAYRLPPIRQVRQNIANGVWGRPKLVQLFRATGYTDKDADDMADGFIREEDRKKREHLLSIAKKELEEGWEIGTLSDEDFIDTITLSGIPQDEARVLLGAATGARNNRLAKELVGQIRKAYLRGTFSWSEADRFLQQVSIVPRRRSEYHTRWDAERQAGRRDVAMASLRRLVIEGAMTLATYVQRLRNLDYTDQAVEVMLADVRLAIADRERKSMEKLARQAAASEKSRLAALKALERQRKELAKEMAGHATPAKLKTWYCDGLISWQEVTDRLKGLQWSQHDIDMLLGECDGKREKAGLPTYAQESGRPQPPT